MLTRKTYIKVAKQLAEFLEDVDGHGFYGEEAITDLIMSIFEEDNPRFNEAKFLKKLQEERSWRPK